MSLPIEVKPLTETDGPSVSEFVYLLIDEVAPGSEPDRSDMALTADEILPLDTVSGFLATLDAKLLGVIVLNECAAIYAGGKFGEITELYVLPEYRSRGVAAKLVEAAEHYAINRGWKRLEVGTPGQPAWDRTLKFYMREGFEEVGTRLRKRFA